MSDKELIRLENVGMSFGGRYVLNNVNLTISRNDFMAITGPNGGGKTTFLRILLRLLRPTCGHVFYNPNDEKMRVGYLPQKNMIDSKFPISVKELVELGLYGIPMSKVERSERIDEMLEMVGMQDHSSSGIGALSGGQLQRALLARSIIARPDLLVLDEPLSYVDKRFEHRIYDIISDLAPHTTIILVSHEMSTIASMANRHIIVDHELHICRSAHHFIHYDCCDDDC